MLKVREPLEGMGQAVAKRTVFREDETWLDVANRVAEGNCSLHKTGKKDFESLRDRIAEASVLMSGRHLQHGDSDQPKRPLEVYSNCTTAATSFMKFNLLLNGAGVGRSYDDSMMLVNWDYMPKIRAVLSFHHADYSERYDSAEVVIAGVQATQRPGSYRIFEVEDSREGWAKVMEILEVATWRKTEKNKTYIFDFSKVRPEGSPIGGMQDRPSSGPVPFMKSIYDIFRSVRDRYMPLWKQSIFVDHFLAKAVVVGGARRAARIATKYWKDDGAFEFCTLKADNPETLWSANYSLAVDEEFWEGVRTKEGEAWKIFLHATKSAYTNLTGEPGFVNYDRFSTNLEGVGIYEDGEWSSDFRYKLEEGTKDYHARIYKAFRKSKVKVIPNPCQPSWATVMTPDGIRTMGDVDVGDTIWSGKRWTKIVRKESTGVKDVYEYATRAGSFFGTENHKIVSNGTKVEVGQAESIDTSQCDAVRAFAHCDTQSIVDGLVLGDGTVHKASNDLVLLCIGANDQDYFHSKYHGDSIGGFIGRHREALKPGSYEIETTITANELPLTYNRSVPERFRFGSHTKAACFLRGLYSANGSVVANRVTLKAGSFNVIQQVQEMLSSLGIRSYYTTNRPSKVVFSNGEYDCKESYDLNISTDRKIFRDLIGFIQEYKQDKLNKIIADVRATAPKRTYDIVDKQLVSREEVFDITVDDPDHTYWTGGLLVSNCGEISLLALMGYCVIADLAPYHLENVEDFELTARLTARALIRTNLMNAIYKKEITRTNRIGVGLTGVHEFAWKFFGFDFHDLINEEKSQPFWDFLKKVADAIDDECETYSKELGVAVPHTTRTVKPAGTTSKLFHLTEGIHLPPMREYIRWVQFKNEDPLVDIYREAGYPVRRLEVYNGMSIVGFPHQPEICKLGMNENIILADEATPDQQYQWLMLMEKYWLSGEKGNQASYTLKYDPDNVTLDQFRRAVAKYQPQIKCCSIMPRVDATIYEYQPEQAVSKEEFREALDRIEKESVLEDVSMEALKCDSGACPL